MQLRAGDEQPWPQKSQTLHSGELLLVVQQRSPQGGVIARQSLVSMKAQDVLPARPTDLNTSLELRIRAVQDCVLEPLKTGTPANHDSLRQRLGAALTQTPQECAVETSPLGALIEGFWEQEQNRQRRLQDAHIPLNEGSDHRLFLYLEQAQHNPAIEAGIGTEIPDPLQACVKALLEDNAAASAITTLKLPIRPATEPRVRLQQLLGANGLIGREIILQGDLRKEDCGDVIAFLSDASAAPLLLHSTPEGYQAWLPDRMVRPLPLNKLPNLLGKINPRAIGISPEFQPGDLSTLGLLRFAYGEPKHRSRFAIGGLLLGLVLGFVLSIGREVGAARWIFGMGLTGLAMGTSIGLLSGGFRVSAALMLLATLLGLLTPTFNTVITNQAIPDRDLGLLLQISGILIATGLTRVALEWTQSQSLLLPQQRGAARSQLASIHHMLALPINFFRSYSTGDLQLRFGALDELREEIQALLDKGLLKAALTSIYLLFLLKISVKLTLLAIVIALMLLAPTAIIGIQSRPLQRKQEEIDGEAQTRNLELISSVSKLRVAGAETRAAQWWADQFRRSILLEEALTAKESIARLLGGTIPNLGNLLIYIVITKLLAEAAASPNLSAPNTGQLLGFFSAFGTFIGSMASFAELLVGAFDVPVIYERAKPILDAQAEVADALLEMETLQGRIQFDRVSYRYEPGLPLVLDSISFTANPGEFLAIVGPSGSGKSTIVRLILAFAKPEDGVIRIDGQPLNGLRPDSLRRQIGAVLQSNALFNGSLFEAIAGGQLITLEEAWEAAAMAGLADEIQQMPMGMQTVIPEGGGTLSGGQRQRLAIARAIVRRPRLLIFDEATSALDNRTQAVVSQSLEQLAITRVVVAHRLSTICRADRILVLQRGQVRQQGSFETLMTENGLFARMMERQIA